MGIIDDNREQLVPFRDDRSRLFINRSAVVKQSTSGSPNATFQPRERQLLNTVLQRCLEYHQSLLPGFVLIVLDQALLSVKAGAGPGPIHCDGIDTRILTCILHLDKPGAYQSRTLFATLKVPSTWGGDPSKLPDWPEQWTHNSVGMVTSQPGPQNRCATQAGQVLHGSPASLTERMMLFISYAVFPVKASLPPALRMPNSESSRYCDWHHTSQRAHKLDYSRQGE
jgi:hypothetical protein